MPTWPLWVLNLTCNCPFEGNHNADVALDKIEFDIPDINSETDFKNVSGHKLYLLDQKDIWIRITSKLYIYYFKKSVIQSQNYDPFNDYFCLIELAVLHIK